VTSAPIEGDTALTDAVRGTPRPHVRGKIREYLPL
jgi:hypothetical protein